MMVQPRATLAMPFRGQSLAALPAGWVALAAVTLACAAAGPRLGSPGAWVMAAILVASVTSSIAGFAFSAICGAMLFHAPLDAVRVVQIMMTCSIANQAAMTWAMRRDVDWRNLGLCLLGAAVGVPLGIWALLDLDRRLFTQALGVFLLAYGGYMLVRPPLTMQRQPRAFDALAGFLGGITGGAVGFPGAFLTIWCGCKGWDKTRQRALVQPFILIVQVATLLAISLLRHTAGHGPGFAPGNLLCVPAALLGTAIGMALFRRLSNRQFALAVNVLLIAAGASFVL